MKPQPCASAQACGIDSQIEWERGRMCQELVELHAFVSSNQKTSHR
jgi:hypothetical protein